MLIIENIVFSGQRVGGISVVWYEHVRRLLNDESLDARFIEYAGADRNIFRRKIEIPPEKMMHRSSRWMKYRRFFNPRLDIPGPFIFHSSDYRTARNRNAVNVVTVHDFIYFLNVPKGLYRRLVKWIHCYQMENAIKSADYVVCISENTRRDLLRFIPGVGEEKLRVIHNGVSGEFYPVADPENSALPYPAGSYVLFIGSRSRYKNFRLAAEAVSKSEFSLVIIGNKLNEEEEGYVRENLGEGRYTCITALEIPELNRLYNGAFCLLYPSSYEGFGIPVLEAQRAGCPVIAYRASSIPEVIGDTPLLLDELSVKDICDRFDLLRDKKAREKVTEQGSINAGRFSWDRTYEQFRQLYREIEAKMNKR